MDAIKINNTIERIVGKYFGNKGLEKFEHIKRQYGLFEYKDTSSTITVVSPDCTEVSVHSNITGKELYTHRVQTIIFTEEEIKRIIRLQSYQK